MNLSIIGTGYVGLVTGACLAELGHRVVCFDRNENKIRGLKRGKIPIYEPGLSALVKKNIRAKRLIFTTNYTVAVNGNAAIFIAVGTPPLSDGRADLSAVYEVAERIAKELRGYAVIVNKSTVPVGTGQAVKQIITKYYSGRFDVASCPEFLREGLAIKDFLIHPSRIVIGTESIRAQRILLKAFKPLKTTKLTTTLASAELIKYASNAFLATKISFINEISNLCDAVRADVGEVARGMGLDPRIGPHFLKAGLGYGGSCFPKDVSALKHLAGANGYDFKLLRAVIEVNNAQRKIVIAKAKQLLGTLKGKRIGVLGLAFKNDTDDVRESAALDVIRQLQKFGARISAYDPVATERARPQLKNVLYKNSALDLANGQDLLVIATEWNEFITLDWTKIKSRMRAPNIVDGRNLLDPLEMNELGFEYLSVGR